ncbi:MAG: hypothetical protein HXL68_04450, partial [Dechloromonas agitata]|nr:hypothetical protein [Dechloromonas agitata]
MKGRLTAIALLLGGVMLTGCSSTGGGSSPLIPDKAIQLTAGTSISLSTLASAAMLGAAVYVIYDPLAPNWEIEETRLNDS